MAGTGDVGNLVLLEAGAIQAVETRQVHVRGLVVGRLRPGRARHRVLERRVGVELEQVQRQMVGRERDRLVHGPQPGRERLARQPEHQVEAEIRKPGGPRLADRRARARGIVHPAKTPQFVVVERLHAEADAIHAGGEKALEARRRRRLRIGLERDFGVGRQRERLAAGADEARDFFRFEQRRRAAAEEDRVGGAGRTGIGIAQVGDGSCSRKRDPCPTCANPSSVPARRGSPARARPRSASSDPASSRPRLKLQ